MHDLIRDVAHYAAMLAEGIAVVIIMFGFIGALGMYARKTYFIRADHQAMAQSRNHLGHSLSLALEFKMPSGWLAHLAPLAITITMPFGVTADLASHHPWESIKKYLKDTSLAEFYMGSFI